MQSFSKPRGFQGAELESALAQAVAAQLTVAPLGALQLTVALGPAQPEQGPGPAQQLMG